MKMIRKLFSRDAFSLVEVLVSIVIVGLISSMGWFAVSSYTQSEMVTRNRVLAVNLMQKSQEDLRAAAQTFFDQLEDNTCDFISGNPCGLDPNITTGLPLDYSVNLTITREASAELKRALITVNWSEFGAAHSINTIVFLARPPEPVPGNVIGRVRGSNTGGNALSLVTIRLTPSDGSSDITTITTPEWLHTNLDGTTRMINYDYSGTTGRFSLKPGSYILTAQRSGYSNYTHPTQVNVSSNQETIIDFTMTVVFSPPPVCGNGVCQSGESCVTCPVDCGPCPPPRVCGNGSCEGRENCENCENDCGICSGL